MTTLTDKHCERDKNKDGQVTVQQIYLLETDTNAKSSEPFTSYPLRGEREQH